MASPAQSIPDSSPTPAPVEKKRKRNSESPQRISSPHCNNMDPPELLNTSTEHIENEDDIIAAIEKGGKNTMTLNEAPVVDPTLSPSNDPTLNVNPPIIQMDESTQEPTHPKTQPESIHPFFAKKKTSSASQPNPQQSKNEIRGTPIRERSKSSTYPNGP